MTFVKMCVKLYLEVVKYSWLLPVRLCMYACALKLKYTCANTYFQTCILMDDDDTRLDFTPPSWPQLGQEGGLKKSVSLSLSHSHKIKQHLLARYALLIPVTLTGAHAADKSMAGCYF